MKNKNLVIINFKTYKESTGSACLKIVRAANSVSDKFKGLVIFVPQLVDIRLVVANTKLPVFAQHVDVEEPGSHTGAVCVQSLKQAGVKGVLINHSEKRVSFSVIKKTVDLLKRNNLVSVVCVKDAREAKSVSSLRPDFIAVEPPELIGGVVSVSEAKPELIKKTVNSSQGVNVLCGAGIHTKEDVRVSKFLGARGVLVASGVVKAKNVKSEIVSLLRGLEN